MIAHKTKATMPGRLNHTSLPKHHQVIRFASGVQNLSTPVLGGTNPFETASCIYPTSNRNKANSFGVVQTKHRNSPSLPVRRNLLIKLNCAEMELANSLILSRNAQSVCREIKGEQGVSNV